LFFLLAAWFYILSQLVLLGAVLNRFRLGPPEAKGLVASPMRKSREVRRPVEAITEAKTGGGSKASTAAPRRRRASGYFVALALLATAIFRRRKRTTTP